MASINDRLKKYQTTYDKHISTVEDDVELQGKKLEKAMVGHIETQLKWNRLYSKVYALHQEAKTESESKFGRAYTDAVSDAYKSVSSTDAKHKAMCDDNYIKAKQLETRVVRLEKEIEGVIDVLESRKYILKDLAATIIKECDGRIL